MSTRAVSAGWYLKENLPSERTRTSTGRLPGRPLRSSGQTCNFHGVHTDARQCPRGARATRRGPRPPGWPPPERPRDPLPRLVPGHNATSPTVHGTRAPIQSHWHLRAPACTIELAQQSRRAAAQAPQQLQTLALVAVWLRKMVIGAPPSRCIFWQHPRCVPMHRRLRHPHDPEASRLTKATQLAHS